MDIIINNWCCGRGLKEALYIIKALQAKNINCSYSLKHIKEEYLKHNAELVIYDKKYMTNDLSDKVLDEIVQMIQYKEKENK